MKKKNADVMLDGTEKKVALFVIVRCALYSGGLLSYGESCHGSFFGLWFVDEVRFC